MSKLKVSIKKSTVTAMMKAGRKERINETELSQLARIKPCGIMHVTKTKKDSVIYTCPANINLTDRLKKAISKYDFFFMMEQIVIMVEDVYNNGLNVNSVRFNMDDVYINEMTKEMYFIYFPIVGGQESADIVGFIENIIYTMTPVINEDTNYISRFMYYVRSFHGFNGNAIEKYISREERAVVNVLKNKAVTMQQTMQQQIMQQQIMQQQTMQQVMQGSMDGTTVLSDDSISIQQIQQMQPVNYHFASLTRQVTGEKIELGKPSFVLGKNPEKSDYAVAGNTNISRVHAVITMRNGRYYVMDQNSTNGTFINGRIIKAGQETEILPGDCLMLANEEFIFNE
ncbi:FHA domain-containing protein [Agathobacter rectalis]|uniref:FHA domain-containing protein n=1 Tax=Agathobacter rectalis TaxID=39491 RepID=A0A396FPZ7_9FIRM|nr:FHA domain-containing protein [Agathobacter rectalis]RHL76551.1 FHA domain-containing protein [Agathobacter rectalis]